MKIERIRGSDATDRTYTYKIERKIRMFWILQNIMYWDQNDLH